MSRKVLPEQKATIDDAINLLNQDDVNVGYDGYFILSDSSICPFIKGKKQRLKPLYIVESECITKADPQIKMSFQIPTTIAGLMDIVNENSIVGRLTVNDTSHMGPYISGLIYDDMKY